MFFFKANPCFVALLVLILCCSSISSFGFQEEEKEGLIVMTTVGGVRDSQINENSVEIEELGRFAVEEHNKKEVRRPFFLSECNNIAC